MIGSVDVTIWEPFGIFAAAFIFGLGYNALVSWIGDSKDTFSSLFVALGVGITCIFIGILDLFVDWNAGFIALDVFIATGAPMIGGQVWRCIKRDRMSKCELRIKELARGEAEKMAHQLGVDTVGHDSEV